MCLAVPGKILERKEDEGPLAFGTVDFQGTSMEINLALVPEARVGDWVLVHAGLAISTLDEEEARETWSYLKDIRLDGAAGRDAP